MGTSTLIQLRNRVCLAVSRNSSDILADTTTTVGSMVDNLLNDAQRMLSRRYSFNELFHKKTYTLTSAVNTYALTTLLSLSSIELLHSIVSVTVSDGSSETTMQYIDPVACDRVYLNASTTSGRPSNYTIRGASLEVYPYPDQAYTLSITINQFPTPMTASTTSDLNNMDDILVYAAIASFLRMQRKMDEANEWQTLLTNEIVNHMSVNNRAYNTQPAREPFTLTTTINDNYFILP